MKTHEYNQVRGREMYRAVTHILEEGETWADFGMDQPNPHWSHDATFKGCAVCHQERDEWMHYHGFGELSV